MAKIPVSRYPRPLQGTARYRRPRRKSLVQQYQDAHNKANEANESRYKEILQGYDSLHGRAMADLSGMGNTQRADINRSYQGQSANVYNSLVNRGFGNSSLPTTMQAGVMRNRDEAHSRLNESLARQRIGYDTAITQGKLGVMERRNDVGPDPNQLIALAQGLGRGGYGSGFRMGSPIGIGAGLRNAYANALQNHMARATFGLGRGGGYVPRRRVTYAQRLANAQRRRAAKQKSPPLDTVDIDSRRLQSFQGYA